MAALVVTVVLALLGGSLYLTRRDRRINRIKRLGEAAGVMPPGPELDWMNRRLRAEGRVLRRESRNISRKEKRAAFGAFRFGIVSATIFLAIITTPGDHGLLGDVLAGIGALSATFALLWVGKGLQARRMRLSAWRTYDDAHPNM